MYIKCSPIRRDEVLTAHVNGDIITVNGAHLDFSMLQDGESLPVGSVANKWIVGEVSRQQGAIHLTLALPHGQNAPQETRFPDSYYVAMFVPSGEVPLPPHGGCEE